MHHAYSNARAFRKWRRALLGRLSASYRVLRGGRRHAALAAPLHATPLVRYSRPPRRHIRCGGVAFGRRSSAAAGRVLCAVHVVVSCGARSLRATVGESSCPLVQSPSRCSRGAASRGAARALLAFAVPSHPMRRCGAQSPLLCSGGSRSLRGARHRKWRRALSAGCRRRAVACLGAVAVALVSRRRRTRRRLYVSRASRAVACDAAVWRLACRTSAAAARAPCAVRVIASGGARSLRAAVGELSRPSGWSLPRCSRGAADFAPLVRAPRPPCHPMRCGGVILGRRPTAAARALCAVRVAVSGGARFLQAAVGESSRPSGRSPSHCSRGVATRGAARVLCARRAAASDLRCGARPPLLCGGGSHSLRGARRRPWRSAFSAGYRRRVVASFGTVAVALPSQRRCTRRRSCASHARRATASDSAV